MSNTLFTHLHAHTEFSLLDSSNKIKKYIDHVKDLGMSSAAITDHGTMYGVVDFYKYAKSVGIHPVIGCEVYVSPDRLTDKGANKTRYYHLVLLAENNTGYQNLIKLVSIGFTKGFYYRPRVDLETLNNYHEGIIALSGCLAGEVAKKLISGSYEQACTAAERYQSIFGHNNFFLEMQDHGIKEQKIVNQGLLQISKSLEIPLVATNDIHYTYKDDEHSHDVLLCIQTGKKIYDQNRLRYIGAEFYVKSQEEMNILFSFAPEAIKNTQLIAERCQVELTFGNYHLPKYNSPEGYTSMSYLKRLCQDGIRKRYPKTWNLLQERLDYELNTINQMGFINYFLIVWDFINYAIQNGIAVGPGRGSAAGSIVAYCLNITDIDPIRYNLLFERFLNPERITMPDIDIDFCMERRQEVIEYVNQKYGKDKVAQIITFGTMAAKGVIRDVGRVLDYPLPKVDKIAKLIGNQPTIDAALLNVSDLKREYETNLSIRELIDTAKKLEGLPRHTSTHAAGVVISPKPVDEFVPLAVSNDGTVTTQYIMTAIEELGILKIDFLGLRTLTVIQKSVELIKQNRCNDFNFNYNDNNVYEYISTGQTDGIFQLESMGMKDFMKKLKPQTLEDIIAGISLYRPGPMEFIPDYIRGKNNPNDIQYKCTQLEPILKYTYGCIIYQEQVMQIVRDLAGYSYGRSDLLRRAMSKKKQDVMEDERQIFLYGDKDSSIPGCLKNGISEVVANKIYDSMIDFAKYAFNKSHAAAYAVISYQTAYLKYHYPLEFLASLMTSMKGNVEKLGEYLILSKKMTIKVMQPDINKSSVYFTVQDEAITYSLSAIKDIGEKCACDIITVRKDKPFSDFENFIRRMSLKEGMNKNAIESLIKAGAFDCFKKTRKELLETFPNLMNQFSYAKRSGMAAQKPLFQLSPAKSNSLSCKKDEFPDALLFEYEKEVLGNYLSGHPLDAFYTRWESSITSKSTDFLDPDANNLLDGQKVTVGGLLTSVTIKATKSRSMMAYLKLDDFYGSMEVIVFPHQYEKYKSFLTEDNKLLCSGTVKIEDQKSIKVIADTLTPLCNGPSELWVQFSNIEDFNSKYYLLLKKAKENPGENLIILYLKDSRQIKKMEDNKVMITSSLVDELVKVFGVNNVRQK